MQPRSLRGRRSTSHSKLQRILCVERAYAHERMTAIRAHRSRIAAPVNALDARHGLPRQEIANLIPVVRRPEREFEDDFIAGRGGVPATPLATNTSLRFDVSLCSQSNAPPP